MEISGFIAFVLLKFCPIKPKKTIENYRKRVFSVDLEK